MLPHDPTVLPADLPVPQDDGAARHLAEKRLPAVPLVATDGTNDINVNVELPSVAPDAS